ncbi:CPBP family intramembrane glutamic endopeptidase [Pseudarthrobacter defluvii]|uniref:CPBP family intramembrane glutamic endopeptidase n=1 Tax=Pseudarthrobacter defluvii TaxID=410837 RepID=UPI0027D786E3|nr:CPBP family intramembrane glutamic endopeptidase [Pseudarthrobacter defluvii]
MITFYVLVLVFLIFTAGPVALLGSGAGGEAASAAEMGPVMYVTAVLAGPLCYALAAVVVIALASGRAGLSDLRARSMRWRVGIRWYAVALLTAPLLQAAILFAFLLTSKAFLPDIATAEDRASLLIAALVAGLVAGFFEELGWTGFATPEHRKRHSLLATGLLVGLPWCLLHSPIYLATDSGAIPMALYVPVMAFSVLLPYRVLMVWVYDHTQSVLMAMLMHLPISASAFLLGSAAMVGLPDLIFNLVFGATLWVLVAATLAADRPQKTLAIQT